MGEVLFGHQIVGLEGAFDVCAVYANSNAHDHVLWAFSDTAVDTEEVRTF